MFSEFFTARKKGKEEIPDTSRQKLDILEGMPQKIKQILERAQLFEKEQLEDKDLSSRKELCENGLIEYQKALDLIREASKKHRKNKEFSQQDIYDAQDLKISERMEYLETTIKGLKSKLHRIAA